MKGLHELCLCVCFVCLCVCVQHVNSVASLICFAYTLSHSFSLPFMSFSGFGVSSCSENKPFSDCLECLPTL